MPLAGGSSPLKITYSPPVIRTFLFFSLPDPTYSMNWPSDSNLVDSLDGSISFSNLTGNQDNFSRSKAMWFSPWLGLTLDRPRGFEGAVFAHRRCHLELYNDQLFDEKKKAWEMNVSGHIWLHFCLYLVYLVHDHCVVIWCKTARDEGP